MIDLGRYQNRCVADLAWAVSSPPLLHHQSRECEWFRGRWYLDQYRRIEAGLRELDRDPVGLERLLAAQKDQRLGNYFETLWAVALELNPRYHLVERNLQIIDGERTLGEMDFIVRDNETGRYAHWELAIKFYLGVGDTVRHDAWHGPGKKDRLDIKVDHLLRRQTLLSSHPRAKAVLAGRGIEIEDCAVILKGRLFYPWLRGGPEDRPLYANPAHLDGHWVTRKHFQDFFGAHSRFMPLVRSGWMADRQVRADRAHTASELLRQVDSGLWRLPLHVAGTDGSKRPVRLFVVDDQWPDFYKT